MTEIIIKAYDVLDEMINDPLFKKIKKLNRNLDNLYENEINAFNNAKIKYDQVLSEGGTYHPDYKETIKKLSQTKQILYKMPEVAKYLEAEIEFETRLNQFLNDISKTISDHVPAPNKFGMIKKGGSCHVH